MGEREDGVLEQMCMRPKIKSAANAIFYLRR